MDGQLQGILKMMEEGVNCNAVATQLSANESVQEGMDLIVKSR